MSHDTWREVRIRPGRRRWRRLVGTVAVVVAPWAAASPTVAASDVTIEILDSNGSTASMVLDPAGNPVVAYVQNIPGDLRFVHCNDPACAGGDEVVTTLETTGVAAEFPTLLLGADGVPVILYHDFSDDQLWLLRCDDPDCTSSVESLITSAAISGLTTLVLDDAGLPAISYYELGRTQALRVVRCNDPDCVGGDESVETIDGSDSYLWGRMVLDATGHPVIAYHQSATDDLGLVRCNDPNCAGGDESDETVDAAGDTGHWPTLALDAAGNPVIAYVDATNRVLRVAHCNDPKCAGGDETVTTADDTTEILPSLVLDATGNPVIAYAAGETRGDPLTDRAALRVLHCGDPDCSGGEDAIHVIDGEGVAFDPSLALDAEGFAVVAYTMDVVAAGGTFTQTLRLARCHDLRCTVDTTAPRATIALAADQAAITDAGPVRFSVTFDEPVVGFGPDDLVVGGTAGATAGTISGSGPTYTVSVDVIPRAGTVTLGIAAGAVTDVAGNPSGPSIVVADTVTIRAGATPGRLPPTGDPSAVTLWFAVLLLPAGSALLVVARRR